MGKERKEEEEIVGKVGCLYMLLALIKIHFGTCHEPSHCEASSE